MLFRSLLLQGDALQEKSMLSYWFLLFLEVAFWWGVIFSLTLRSNLEIDQSQGKVRYRLSTLFQNQKWEKVFSEFQDVRIFRPGTGDGRAVMLKVLLRSKEGEEIPLGTSLFGVYQKQKARLLAQQVAEIMSLRVIEESSIKTKI